MEHDELPRALAAASLKDLVTSMAPDARLYMAVGTVAAQSAYVEHMWRMIGNLVVMSKPGEQLLAGQPVDWLITAVTKMAPFSPVVDQADRAKLTTLANETRALLPDRNNLIHGVWTTDGVALTGRVSKRWQAVDEDGRSLDQDVLVRQLNGFKEVGDRLGAVARRIAGRRSAPSPHA